MADQSIAAMVLAAGRGERMRPLTDATPKPLLTVQGTPLMQWHLQALASGGFCRAVINTAWLGQQIADYFGNVFAVRSAPDAHKQLSNQEHSVGHVQILYSHEGHDFGGALETAGGIVRALPLLCPGAERAAADPTNGVFWVVAGDVFAPDFVFCQADVDRFVASGKLCHLWLVPNPDHNPRGDFGLAPDDASTPGNGLALSLPSDDPRPRYTYSTIGLYRASLFAPPWCDVAFGNPKGIKAALAPLLRAAMARQQVSAEMYHGRWTDVGTPQRLRQIKEA